MERQKLTEYLQPLVILVSVVWTIATIQGTTENLGLKIENLGKTIVELKDAVTAQKNDLVNLKERIIRLEVESDKSKK